MTSSEGYVNEISSLAAGIQVKVLELIENMPESPHAGQDRTEYNLPRNDVVESARLDEQANGFVELMHGKIVHVPLQDPRKLVDVGCGTGIVCRQLAQQYPAATVYGVDISPVPPCSNTPKNVEYIIADIKQLADANDERIPNGEIDYIFQRLLIFGMTDWPGHVQYLANLLRSGGYIEIQEYPATIFYKCSSTLPQEGDEVISFDWKWVNAMRRGAEQLGLDLEVGANAAQYMKDAGLVDIQVTKYAVPFGTWMAGERPETRLLGVHQAESLAKAISQSAFPGITRGLGIGEKEMAELQEECRRCMAAEEGKYWIFYVTTGRKA